ncbi:TIGR03960 family B12-binding radical SAM protein [candidate division KSB1 bacterium]|nr:TIGR03960 family B12-binding radical SAM protein [candidate division KSB1 bacterium]
MEQHYSHFVETELLPFVNKPGRYAGNEFNSIIKDWDQIKVSFGLIFPELYELAMSYQGFSILYHLLNRDPGIVAERIFAPDEDFEALLRIKDAPLFSLETKRPLKAFDILGFTVQYELHYTNILNVLDLGKIPLITTERDDTVPLIIAGGPCVFNPEPLSNYIDAFVIGDGEEVIFELAHVVELAKQEKWGRRETLKRLTQIEGVYVPEFYVAQTSPDGKFAGMKPVEQDVPATITARIIPELKAENYPENPIVPLIDITHNRLGIEIMRGCSRSCRFCNAGMIYRPVRERPVDEIVSYTMKALQSTGYEEVSLLSLSTSDYSKLQDLLSKLITLLNKKQIKLSFPSLRPETFISQISAFANEMRNKGGLTLAPEAGTTRLRGVINKTNTNEDLLKAVQFGYENGWTLVKLYFMLGLPTETREDLDGLINLIWEVIGLARASWGKKINVSLSPFIPKPHTPFQWEGLCDLEELREKVYYIKKNLRYKHLDLSWRDPEIAYLEATLARGDRRVGTAVYHAWKAGAKFDGWTNKFDYQIWDNAFKVSKIDPNDFVKARATDEIFPWDHISKGITRAFLLKEREKATAFHTTLDCREDTCHGCGLMQQPECQKVLSPESQRKRLESAEIANSLSAKTASPQAVDTRLNEPTGDAYFLRINYRKNAEMRFTSHLDMIRIFERAFRRSELPIAFSQGFSPHPKISYGLPLAIGHTSEVEYLDVQLIGNSIPTFEERLSRHLPRGVELIRVKKYVTKPQSLTATINRADYRIKIRPTPNLQEHIDKFRSAPAFPVSRKRKNQIKVIDIKPYVQQIALNETDHRLIEIITRLINGKTARIDEILEYVLGFTPEQVASASIERIGVFIQRDDRLLTPMDI